MKARHEFKTDEDYEDYLLIYFSSLLLPHIINHEYGNEEYATDYACKISLLMIEKLPI